MQLKSVTSALKRYNANNRDANTGDCVKRAISLALDIPYDVVSTELNRIRKELHASTYALTNVFNTYLERKGYHKYKSEYNTQNVREFCEEHPHGTYLLLVRTSLSVRGSNHIVCIIDGDIYDSWDSSRCTVNEIYLITKTQSDLGVVNVANMWEHIKPYIEAYLSSMNSKDNSYIFDLGDVRTTDRYTMLMQVRCYFQLDPPESSAYSGQLRTGHVFVIKTTPRGNTSSAIEHTIKSLKQKIYDWAYTIKKDISDATAAEQLTPNPKFRGHRRELMKVPEWARPLVTYFSEYDNMYTDKYKVYMENLPGDPRANECEDVSFRADTLRELKWQMEEYKKNFHRLDYDY